MFESAFRFRYVLTICCAPTASLDLRFSRSQKLSHRAEPQGAQRFRILASPSPVSNSQLASPRFVQGLAPSVVQRRSYLRSGLRSIPDSVEGTRCQNGPLPFGTAKIWALFRDRGRADGQHPNESDDPILIRQESRSIQTLIRRCSGWEAACSRNTFQSQPSRVRVSTSSSTLCQALASLLV
jgi:hypothetical protein